MMRVVAVVQARMGSSRLPGKVLRDIEGKTMLARVVERLRRCRSLDAVVVATTKAPDDDAIVSAGRELGAPVVRGPGADVLARYVQAVAAHPAQHVVRVTADCPLIDPDVVDDVVMRYLADPKLDYASNKIPPTWPRGLDVEVFSRAALERAAREATLDYERSHVTAYMYDQPGRFTLLGVNDSENRSSWRWTVDTAEDLAFVQLVYKRLGSDGAFGWRDVVALVEREPGLAEINAHVRQRDLHEG